MADFENILRHAEEKLQRKPHTSLAHYRELFKKFLKAQDHKLLLEHRKGLEGLAVCRQRARMIDVLISHIYRIAEEEYSRKHPKDITRCAVVAVGGYGRGELNFHSDVDIMFLFSEEVGNFGKFIANKVLYLLWDIGLAVGHSTRTLSDALQICTGDLASRTAIFESRLLTGDAAIYSYLIQRLTERFAKVDRVVRAYIEQKLQERQQRHLKFGSSMYLQEPNVKESVGGIRDLHNVLWALRLEYGSINLDLARAHQLITDSEAHALVKAYDFLLAVRNELHLNSGKKMDILLRQYQPKIAAVFGYKDRAAFSSAELFMKDYYLAVRTVSSLTASVLSKLREPHTLAEQSLRLTRRKELESGLAVWNDTLHLAKKDASVFQRDPLLMIRVFSIAQEKGLTLHEDLKGILRNNLHLVNKRFRNSQEAAAVLRTILSCRGCVGSALRAMHETGFLGKYLPEFGKLTCHVQDSDYHCYTVDEHSLKAVEYADSLYSPNCAVHESIRNAAVEIPHPEVVYLALLLHDLGKLDPEDHVSQSLAGAQKVLTRLGFTRDQAEGVLFLIREHLTMSHTAQRRDLEDTQTIMDFSVLVKTMENLQGLLIVTYADACAVAPGTWTYWKEALVSELFIKTEAWLTGRAMPQALSPVMLHETKEKLCGMLEGKISAHTIENHLKKMPSRYPIFTPVSLIAQHITLAQTLQGQPFLLDWSVPSGNETMLEVTVCTRDRLGLFASIAGCFTLSDINIISAQVSTRADGVVLDTFRVSDVTGHLPIETEAMEKFKALLEQALEGSLDLDSAVRRHESKLHIKQMIKKKIAPVVLLDNRISHTKTVLDVQAMDRLGLLFHISKVIAGLRLNIAAAKISTERALAYDVFYVTGAHGGKILDEAVQSRIIRTLQKELAG